MLNLILNIASIVGFTIIVVMVLSNRGAIDKLKHRTRGHMWEKRFIEYRQREIQRLVPYSAGVTFDGRESIGFEDEHVCTLFRHGAVAFQIIEGIDEHRVAWGVGGKALDAHDALTYLEDWVRQNRDDLRKRAARAQEARLEMQPGSLQVRPDVVASHEEVNTWKRMNREAWHGIKMIRDALETLGPVGTVMDEEHALIPGGTGGHFTAECNALVAGVQKIAELRDKAEESATLHEIREAFLYAQIRILRAAMNGLRGEWPCFCDTNFGRKPHTPECIAATDAVELANKTLKRRDKTNG